MMLCSEIDEDRFLKSNWADYIAETKEDGIRCQIRKNPTQFIGRDGPIDMTKFPEVVAAINDMPGGWTLDGELVVFSKDRSDFNLILSRVKTKDKFKIRLLVKRHPATFVAFDMLEHEGVDLRELPLTERQNHLTTLPDNKNFRVIQSYEDPIELYKRACEHSWEGIILKAKDSRYENVRSPDWIKVKRKEVVNVTFTGYQISNAGITLTSPTGHRVACHGSQHIKVKDAIDQKGKVLVEVEGLSVNPETGKVRQIVFKRLIE